MTVTEATPTPTRSRPRRPNVWLVIGGVLTALLLVVGGLTLVSWLRSETQTETQDQVYDRAITDLVIDVDTGDVTLTRGEPGTVTVRRTLVWTNEKPTVDERWDGQTLRVSAECHDSFPSIGRCRVDYAMEVPEGVAVQARTATGNISVSDIEGELRLSISTGDIAVTGATAELRLDTSTGDIKIAEVTSSAVEASADTGQIILEFAAAPRTVSARTSTGDVTVSVPSGSSYRVDADASTGNEHVSVVQDPTAERSLSVRTSTGNIDISYG